MFQIKRKKIFIKPQSDKVNFIVAGTQKAGTTALYHYLKQHPEIGVSSKKELHFFDNENTFAKPYILYSRYEKYFDFGSDEKIYGEATPSYIYWESSCRRIWEYNPEMKLIFILRDPIERAFSSWNMEVDRGNETLAFMQSIRKDRERNRNALPYLHNNFSYLQKGCYSEQIRRYRRFFSDDQLLFVKYENFKSKQREVLKRIFKFLNVDANLFNFQFKIVHKRPKHSKLKAEDREYLLDIFRNDIKEVERMLDWDCSDWLSSS